MTAVGRQGGTSRGDTVGPGPAGAGEGRSALESPRLDERLEAVQRRARVVGLAALAVVAIGAYLEPTAFFRSWLISYLFWIALPLGALGFVCLHHMVGGGWGFVIRRSLEAASGTLPLMALLFLPLLLGLDDLYPWARPAEVAADELLQHKQAYLNVPFFLARTMGYFAVWIGLSWLLNRWSARQDVQEPDQGAGVLRKMQLLSGPGLVLYGLTATFAAIDWAMTLEPHWFSTIYGMIFVAGQGLTTLAFAILLLALLRDHRPLRLVLERKHFHDLGNLTLAFVMLWAYMAYSQYLIIWSGNLPEEITWYLHRQEGGWQYFGPTLMVFHFAIPFLVLLSRRAKRDLRFLGRAALVILALRFVDVFWLVKPAFSPGELTLHWMDLVTLVGMGGVWVWAFCGRLRSVAVLPLYDPRMSEALRREEAESEGGDGLQGKAPAPAGSAT